jgi:hypothetical protein
MRRRRLPPAGLDDLRASSVRSHPHDVKVIVHRSPAPERPFRRLASAEGYQELPARRFLEAIEVERAVALVAQKLHEGRAALFLRRLHLPVRHP